MGQITEYENQQQSKNREWENKLVTFMEESNETKSELKQTINELTQSVANIPAVVKTTLESNEVIIRNQVWLAAMKNDSNGYIPYNNYITFNDVRQGTPSFRTASSNSTFYAPISGLYKLEISAYVNSATTAFVELYVDGNHIMSAWDGEKASKGRTLNRVWVVQINKDQHVRLKNVYANSIYTSSNSQFAFLINLVEKST